MASELRETRTGPRVVGPEALSELVGVLRTSGYRIVAPTVRDGAIVIDEISSAQELPHGWTARQEAATYRLERRDDEAVFGWAVGPHSWKQHFLPSRIRLWRSQRPTGGGAPAPREDDPPGKPLALLGVRPCDLSAIAVQDRVFLDGPYVERDYAVRREGAFLVAVNCGVAGGTCFCASMGTGPRARSGFDLALTEVLAREHRFVVEVGTTRGEDVLAALESRSATPEDLTAAQAETARAEEEMGRRVDTSGLPGLLAASRESPRFDDVAQRCLTCGNCTLVCPTCFCTSVEDVTDLVDGSAERWRVWDNCFSTEYSYIHGGSVRRSPRSRYRQWLTHKFGTWVDQFGTSGCVGCGRCITWCPVGIDVTEELAAIRAGQTEVEHGDAR